MGRFCDHRQTPCLFPCSLRTPVQPMSTQRSSRKLQPQCPSHLCTNAKRWWLSQAATSVSRNHRPGLQRLPRKPSPRQMQWARSSSSFRNPKRLSIGTGGAGSRVLQIQTRKRQLQYKSEPVAVKAEPPHGSMEPATDAMRLEALLLKARDNPELQSLLWASLGAAQPPVQGEAANPGLQMKVEPPVKTEPSRVAEPRRAKVEPSPHGSNAARESNAPDSAGGSNAFGGSNAPCVSNAPLAGQNQEDASLYACNSATHPNTYRAYGRFVLRNPQCQELARAWQHFACTQTCPVFFPFKGAAASVVSLRSLGVGEMPAWPCFRSG